MNRTGFQQSEQPIRIHSGIAGGFAISIIGNKSGLKTKQLRQLERLEQKKVSPDEAVDVLLEEVEKLINKEPGARSQEPEENI